MGKEVSKKSNASIRVSSFRRSAQSRGKHPKTYDLVETAQTSTSPPGRPPRQQQQQQSKETNKGAKSSADVLAVKVCAAKVLCGNDLARGRLDLRTCGRAREPEWGLVVLLFAHQRAGRKHAVCRHRLAGFPRISPNRQRLRADVCRQDRATTTVSALSRHRKDGSRTA